MFDYSCSSGSKKAIDHFVHPLATWTPYDRYYGEEIVLHWTVLYDEPTEAVLIGPDSNFSVVRVILNKGIVTTVEHMVDDEAKAFLDQYECPPDQIVGLHGRHPLGRIRERPVGPEGQSLASIIESRSARVDQALRGVASEKAAAEKRAREMLLRTLHARRHSQQVPSTMATVPPLITTSFLEGSLAFIALSTASVVAGVGGAIAAGLGAGIGVLCVTAGAGSYVTLRELKKRNQRKAASSPHLQFGDGRLVVPQSGEPLIFDITKPYDLCTDWRQLRGNNSTSYLTRTMLTQGHKTILFYSLDPTEKNTLVKMGFLQPDGPLIPNNPDSASFGMVLSDQLKLWRFLRLDSGHW